jgi:predicted phage tail protein
MPKKKKRSRQNIDPLAAIFGQGGGCVAGDTELWTPDGLKPISEFKSGDRILCFTAEEEIVESFVEETFVHHNHEVFTYKFWGGEIVATPNHAFYNERGAFSEVGTWSIDEFFLDSNFDYRPLLEVCDRTVIDVFNLTVNKHHTYLVGPLGILSSNGGGGKKPSSPNNQAEAGRSSSRATVVELISEGPIEGLIAGDQSIQLDRTPVGNADGTKNFEGFKFTMVNGTQNQPVLPATLTEGLTSETNVGVDVQQALPVTRTFINSQVDLVRVRLGFQMQTYQDDGGVIGGNMHFRIFLKQGAAGAFNLVYEENKQNQRFSSLTEFEYQFAVNTQGGTIDEFSVRVQKLSPDPTDSKVQAVLRFQSFTEVINNAKLNYANSAVIDLEFLAEQFSSAPQRAYEVGGRTVAIPTNATVNPTDRGLDYSDDIWDGTLYEPTLACSDVAWQLYDLITNDRYGLGRQINSCQVSAYDLYYISRYNNELIPSGFGTTERRFRCNTVLQTKQQAHEFLQAMMGNCRAHYYWDGSCIRFWQDRPTPITRQFTNSDVEEGQFKYSSTDIQTRNSVANVTWNDPEDYYRTTVEPVELQEAFNKFGYRETEFTAYGCTSRGEAYRAGRFALLSGFYNTETVNFKSRLIGIYARPGDVIAIADWHRAKQRYGGLVVAATTTSVTLDAAIDLPTATGYSLTCLMPDLTLETRVITNGIGSHEVINVSTPFSVAPLTESNWIADVIQPRLYRVQSMKADTNDLNSVEIVAAAYREDIYAATESGWVLEPLIREELSPAVPPVPVNVSVSFRSLSVAAETDYVLTARWDNPTLGGQFIIGYQVQWKRGEGGTWSQTSTTTERIFEVSPVVSGTYILRVSAMLISGGVSNWSQEASGIAGTTTNLYLNYTLPRSLLTL